jgi:hypothetical protein
MRVKPARRSTALGGVLTQAAFLLATQAGIGEEVRGSGVIACRRHDDLSDQK